MKKHTQNRMTIVEVIVAMGVLAIIMSVLIGMVNGMNKVAVRQRAQAEIYEQQRLVFDILTRDLSAIYTSDRPGLVVYQNLPQTGTNPVCLGRFVTSSGIGQEENDRSSLLEVGYFWFQDDSTLYRAYTSTHDLSGSVNGTWDFYNATTVNTAMNDDGATGFEDASILATNVNSVRVTYYSNDGSEFLLTDTSALPAYAEFQFSIYDKELGADEDWSNRDITKHLQVFKKKVFINKRDW